MAGERSLLVRFGADLSPLEKAVIKAAKSVETFGRSVVSVGKTLTASITAPLAGLGAAAIAASETIDDAMDTIRLGTGATGADLEKLGASMKSVYGSVPVAAKDAATAVADLNTRLGLTGAPLEQMSTQMLNLARITKSEVGPMIESSARAFNNWGVAAKDQAGVLDHLWKVSQATGVGVQQLADSLSGGGAALRALGVSVGTAAAMLGGFEKAGVSSETMIGGLTKASSKFAKSGQEMESGLRSVMAQIKAAPSDTAAASIAVETFGKSGLAMGDAIRRGAFDVDKLIASLATSGETINKAAADTDGLAESLILLKNKITLALEPLGVAMTKVFLGMMPLFEGVVAKIKGLVDSFAALPPSVQTSLMVFGALAAATGPALIALGAVIIGAAQVVTSLIALKASGGAAIASITAAYTLGSASMAASWASLTGALAGGAGIFATLSAGVASVGAALLAFVSSPVTLTVAAIGLIAYNWAWLKDTVLTSADALATGLGQVWEGVKITATDTWGSIGPAITSAWGSVVSTAKSLGSTLLSVGADLAKSFYDTIAGGMMSAQDFCTQVWTSITSGLKSVYDWIVDTMSRALGVVAGIVDRISSLVARAVAAIASIAGGGSSPGAVASGGAVSGGSVGGASVSVPALAAGGIVTRPTLALIGEAGPEAVVPLGAFGRMGMASASAGGSTTVVHVHVNGSVSTQTDLADQIRRSLIRTAQRNAGSGVY